MMNRDKSELEQARSFQVGEYGDEGRTAPRDRYPWFGLQLKPVTVYVVGFGLGWIGMGLICLRWTVADRIPGLPHESVWFNVGFHLLIMLMSFISISMFLSASRVLRQDIREIDARMARQDHATEEEVQEYVRRSENDMNRQMVVLGLSLVAAVVLSYILLGTTLVFSWGGIVPFAGAVLAKFIIGILLLRGRHQVKGVIRRVFRLRAG